MHVKSRLFHSLVGLTFVFAAVLVEAGSLVIPAWSFERGNVRVDADPAGFADAGPVVVSGPAEDWGWTVEYDVDIPVEAAYTIQICYASAESRPVNVRVDSKWVGSACDRVTFGPMSSGDAAAPSWKSSGAQWDLVTHQGKIATVWEKNLLAKGKHTLKLTRRQPLPHIVALRLETDAEFPADWQPPRFKVRDMDRIPAKHREAFLSQEGVQAALPPTLVLPKTNASGSLVIPAHIVPSPCRWVPSHRMRGGCTKCTATSANGVRTAMAITTIPMPKKRNRLNQVLASCAADPGAVIPVPVAPPAASWNGVLPSTSGFA